MTSTSIGDSETAQSISAAVGAAPVSPDERVASIDILRGLALFGVMAVNLLRDFRVSIFAQFLPASATSTGVDQLAESLIATVFEFKAIVLFSFLFGVGLAVQYEHLNRTARVGYWLGRRLAVLAAFGLVHMLLIWNGDILTEYAIAGAIALPLLGASRRVLAASATLFMALYFVTMIVPLPIPWVADPAWMRERIAVGEHVYRAGTHAQILRFAAGDLRGILPLELYILPRTISLLLFGVLAWRSRVFTGSERFVTRFANVALLTLPIGAVLTVATYTGMLASWESLGVFRWPLVNAAPIVLALGYAALAMRFLQSPGVPARLRLFAAVGRMAFTCYITQSLIFGWVFFGYGLGLFGRVGVTGAVGLGVFVFAVQMSISAWWLRRFRFGPLEWVWRTLMYGRAQPMLRLATTTPM